MPEILANWDKITLNWPIEILNICSALTPLFKHTSGQQCFLGPSLPYEGFKAFLFIVYLPMNSYLIASVKSIMSDLFRSWPREGLCVYMSGLSQWGIRDVQHRIMAFTYPQRAAYQLCLAQVFDAAEVQMLPCGCWIERKQRIMYCKSAEFPLLYSTSLVKKSDVFFHCFYLSL